MGHCHKVDHTHNLAAAVAYTPAVVAACNLAVAAAYTLVVRVDSPVEVAAYILVEVSIPDHILQVVRQVDRDHGL